jgi:large subunit ribosomal protein L25
MAVRSTNKIKKTAHSRTDVQTGIRSLPERQKEKRKMNSVKIEGQVRSDFGKSATRRLRSEGQVPCVIYGGETEVHFSAPILAFRALVYTPAFQIAEISLGGKTYNCILKDKQFDVVTDELSHVDFLELVEGKMVTANLPLKYVGQPAGVKAGGRLETKMKSLKVRTMPKFLKEAIEVDITELQLNGNMRLQDVVAENMEVMNSPRIPIASIVMTRALKQEATEEAKAGKGK